MDTDNTVLKDGTQCRIALCRSPDGHFDSEELRDSIREASSQLSPGSWRSRFASGRCSLSPGELDYLSRLDNVDHLAWCACTDREPGCQGIALARYLRLPEEPDTAEFAVTVLDRYQGLGVGARLLERLIASAREAGIRCLRGYVVRDNRAMIGLAGKFGGVIHQEDSFIRVDIDTGLQNEAPRHDVMVSRPPRPGEQKDSPSSA